MNKLGAGLLLIGLMAAPVGVSYHFNGISLSPEAMDNAQLARNLARGRGYVTGVIRPASLLFDENIFRHPDLWQPPLNPYLLGAAFRIFGPSDRAAVLWALLLFWGGGLATVYLARRAAGGAAAGLGAVLYFTNPVLLSAVLAGAPFLLGSLLLLGLLLLISRGKNTPAVFLGGGLICGAGYLSTYSPFWFGVLPLLCLVFAFRPEGEERLDGKKISALLAGFILPVLLWWWRAGYLVSPLRAAEFRMYTPTFPGDSLLRETGREIFSRGAGLRTLLLKWWRGAEAVYPRLLLFTGSFIGVFFWAALFLPGGGRKWGRIRCFVFGCLLLGVLQFAVFSRRAGDIRFMVPAAILLAAAAFLFILEKLSPAGSRFRRPAIGLLVILNLVPAIDQLRISPAPPEPTRPNSLRLGGWVGEGAVVVTDRPEAVAWYGDRTALWIPAGVGAVEGFRYLYLTPAALEYLPVRPGEGIVSWPLVYRARGRSPFWEVEEFIPLAGDQFLCRIAPAP